MSDTPDPVHHPADASGLVELVRKAIRTTPACPEWLATEPALAGLPCDACEARNILHALAAAGRLLQADAAALEQGELT